MDNFITVGSVFYLDWNNDLQYKISDRFESNSLDFGSNYKLTKDFFKEVDKDAFMLLVTEIFVFKNVSGEPIVKHWAIKEAIDYDDTCNGDKWSDIELDKKE